jgi:hypothetical protein
VGRNFRVVLYAGLDPVISKRAYLRETVKDDDEAEHGARTAFPGTGELVSKVPCV